MGKVMNQQFTEEQMRVLEKAQIECSDVENFIDDYAENELPRSLSLRIAGHIHECGNCEEVEDSYRMVKDLARSLRDQPLPDGVQARLREALNKRLGIQLSL